MCAGDTLGSDTASNYLGTSDPYLKLHIGQQKNRDGDPAPSAAAAIPVRTSASASSVTHEAAIEAQGKKNYKTAVLRGTLHPSWHERVTLRCDKGDDHISFAIFDEDAASSDDFLGSATLPLSSITQQDGNPENLALPLREGQGILHLVVSCRAVL